MTIIDDNALVARVAATTFAGRNPLHKSLIAMLGDLSQYILNDPVGRRLPQYVALAYWLRPSALTRLSIDLRQDDMLGFLRVPRGVALHLPPTNVDTIFVYSWAMSVLAGNANVVRLAKNLSRETQWLVKMVSQVVFEHGETERQIFCHYEYGGETERALAKHIDLRMIWGGDAKCKAVSVVPIRPDGLSLGFPDRQSLAILSSDAYGKANKNERNILAANFFNDVFWFDQMGCGSPRLLVWLGEPGELVDDFYDRLSCEIRRRGYRGEAGVNISKFVLANELLIDGVANNYRRYERGLDVNRVTDPLVALSRIHGGGFLHEWTTDVLQPLLAVITRKVQTLTYFGLLPEQLAELAEGISGRGGYRIVPIGQALQFDTTWDGVRLFDHMTRRILIR